MTFRAVLTASAAILIGATAAQAAEVAALSGDNTVSIVDTSKKAVTKTWKIEGVAGKVLGIDVRPADGMLYAVGAEGGIYTIDLATGKATMKSKLEKNIDAKSWATVDFNPVADRMRLMSNDGTNLRVNVDDGKVTTDGPHKFADADMHKGEKPNIVAGAYINSVKGAKETALYNIDGTIGALIKQAPPNDGTLNAVGKLGVKVDTVAFDIWSDGNGKNDAWLMAGDWLHSVDLATGKATPAVQIKGVSGVRDIAILPAM
jgi:DNA-binding beta-propeller fold protein YncE